jgi:hypothetical protein
VAAVGDQQHAHAGGVVGEEHGDLVVEEHLARADVPGAQALVAAVGFVAVLVGHPGAVAGVGDDHRVALGGAAHQAADGRHHGGLGGLGVDQLGDGEAAGGEGGGPVVGVIDAAGEVVLGARVVVDADAQRLLAHGLSPVVCHGRAAFFFS